MYGFVEFLTYLLLGSSAASFIGIKSTKNIVATKEIPHQLTCDRVFRLAFSRKYQRRKTSRFFRSVTFDAKCTSISIYLQFDVY